MGAPAAVPAAERWRLRASDFELLFEAGALDDVRKAELIDGDIYGMSPQTTRHARLKTDLGFAIMTRLAAMKSDLRAVVEVSVIAAETSVPEPDIVVSSFRGDRFMPADTVALVVEVSTTTLRSDLGRKAELYAAAGIPGYWVVDVDGQRVVTHSGPGSDGYGLREAVPFGEVLGSTAIEGLDIDTGILRF